MKQDPLPVLLEWAQRHSSLGRQGSMEEDGVLQGLNGTHGWQPSMIPRNNIRGSAKRPVLVSVSVSALQEQNATGAYLKGDFPERHHAKGTQNRL